MQHSSRTAVGDEGSRAPERKQQRMIERPDPILWYAYLALGAAVNAVAAWSVWRWWKDRRE